MINNNAIIRDAVQISHRQSKSIWNVLGLSFVFLICSHLAVKEFFSNPVFWVVGALIIVAAGVFWIYTRNDEFGFLLAIFVCVHFEFAENQGGLWSYVICAVLFIVTVLHRRISIRMTSVPRSTNVLLYIFIFQQIIGTILNSYSTISNIQSTVVTFSHVLIFYYFASQAINNSNLKRLISVWFIVAFYVFIIAVNQHYHWVITNSPLLPQRYEVTGKISEISAGSFGNSELFSEYFCIVFILSLIITMHMNKLRAFNINIMWPLLMVFIASFALFLGTSRAAILLALAATCFITIDILLVVPSVRNIRRIFVLMTIYILIVLIIFNMGSSVSMDVMTKKFKQLNPSKMTIDTVVSGKEINRSTTFNAGYKRLKSQSWWIGYGFNLPENNLTSMGLRKGSGDYHSLYLTLPIYYGWIGALCYILIIISAAMRSLFNYIKFRTLDNCLVPFLLGFAILLGIFMLDEYKITVTRNPSYFLLTWVWLGLTHAICNSMRQRNTALDAFSRK